MEALGTLVDDLLRVTKHFLTKDVPEIMALASHALRKSKLFPASYKEFVSYTLSDWLDVIPVLSSIFVVVATLLIFITSGSGTKEKCNPKHQKVRSYLVRCQALCYASGFITSAIQHRSLWGQHGKYTLQKYFPSVPFRFPWGLIYHWLFPKQKSYFR